VRASPVDAAGVVADVMATGRMRRISLGSVNGPRFCSSAGIGFDAEAVRRLDELGRKPGGARPGDLAFVRMVLDMLRERRGRWEPPLAGGGARAALILVAHCGPYSYAGSVPLRRAPPAR